MPPRPKYTKPDANQSEIFSKVEECGIVIWDLHNVGGEVMDSLMCARGKCIPVEIKNPEGRNQFTQGELDGIAKLLDVGVVVVVATCADDVLRAFGMLADDG